MSTPSTMRSCGMSPPASVMHVVYKSIVLTKDEPGTIVAGEKDACVFGETFFAKRLKDAPDRPVNLFDDIPIQSPSTFVFKLFATKQWNMRQAVWQVDKKRFRLVLLDEVDGMFGVTPRDGRLIGRSLVDF